MLRALILVLALFVNASAQTDLQAPFKVKADGQAIDVTVGHAAPYFVDFDGDGLEDLLVGQFGQGQLRIYRNVGKTGAPAFGSFDMFKAGGVIGKIPAG